MANLVVVFPAVTSDLIKKRNNLKFLGNSKWAVAPLLRSYTICERCISCLSQEAFNLQANALINHKIMNLLLEMLGQVGNRVETSVVICSAQGNTKSKQIVLRIS